MLISSEQIDSVNCTYRVLVYQANNSDSAVVCVSRYIHGRGYDTEFGINETYGDVGVAKTQAEIYLHNCMQIHNDAVSNTQYVTPCERELVLC